MYGNIDILKIRKINKILTMLLYCLILFFNIPRILTSSSSSSSLITDDLTKLKFLESKEIDKNQKTDSNYPKTGKLEKTEFLNLDSESMIKIQLDQNLHMENPKINLEEIQLQSNTNQVTNNNLENNENKVKEINNENSGNSIDNNNFNSNNNNIQNEKSEITATDQNVDSIPNEIQTSIENTPENDSSIINIFQTAASGFSVIILAEIGDKTFFLVMIYSATNSSWSTLIVASSIMLTWNLICLIIGSAIPVLLFKGFLDFLGMIIFLFFGITMIYSAYHMENDLIHKGLNETKSELSRHSLTRMSLKNLEIANEKKRSNFVNENDIKEPLLSIKKSFSEKNIEVKKDILICNNINDEGNGNNFFFDGENYEDEELGFHSKWAFASSLAIAEFGDKTQISSIIMGSTQNFYGVLLGTSLARVCGVLIAIIFGKLIAHNVTHKQVTYLGGFIFLFFAVVYVIKNFY